VTVFRSSANRYLRTTDFNRCEPGIVFPLILSDRQHGWWSVLGIHWKLCTL